MTEADRDWAVVGAVRVDAPGLTYVVGRQTNDTRAVDGGELDAGNARFAGQESLIVFDNVFVPFEHVFMDGEWDYAATLVERFTTYHRSSYVCKTGLGDVLIGAAAEAASHNGVEAVSHIKDKLVEMTHLNETIYSSCMAAAYGLSRLASGAYLNDEMLSNVAKHNVTRFPFEIARLAQDIAGGLMVTMPSEKDFQNNEIGPLIRKFLQGRDGVETVDRMRMLRLIENMTIGRNAVGYLTESLHGAGSPQAQRIQIARGMQIEDKKTRARALAGIERGRENRPGPPDLAAATHRYFAPLPTADSSAAPPRGLRCRSADRRYRSAARIPRWLRQPNSTSLTWRWTGASRSSAALPLLDTLNVTRRRSPVSIRLWIMPSCSSRCVTEVMNAPDR